MKVYGEKISLSDPVKGKTIIVLANELLSDIDGFMYENFNKTKQEIDYIDFKEQFRTKLHSKDKEMAKHRKQWKVITANIAVALSGIGVLAIAGKAIISLLSPKSSSTFFFTKTNCEKEIDNIENQLNLSLSD